jgi:hypothetical protein
MYPSVGGPEGLEPASYDTPVWTRAFLRYIAACSFVGDIQGIVVEFDDGNGMWIHTGESL